MPRRGLTGRLVHFGAFTTGVVVGERMFGAATEASIARRMLDVCRDELVAISVEIGRNNDARLLAVTRKMLLGTSRSLHWRARPSAAIDRH